MVQRKAKRKAVIPQHNENQRIKAIRKLMNLTQQQFAGQIGISQAALSDIENEKNGISYDVFKRILESFHIKSDWLMYRNGDPFEPVSEELVALNTAYTPQRKRKEQAQAAASSAAIDDVRQGPASRKTETPATHARIPLISGKEATQRYAVQYADWEFIQLQPTLELPGLSGQDEYRAFEVRDDNMYPSLAVGDVVVCSLVQPRASLAANQVYLIAHSKHELKIGRVPEEVPATTPEFQLNSDSPNATTLRLNRKQVLQLWKVERIITPNIPLKQSLDHTLARVGHELEALRNEIARTRG